MAFFLRKENIRSFIKWAGGKRQLLSILCNNLPTYNKYYEPFVGAGALLWRLQPKEAIINDVNIELINTYLVIKNKVDELISSLKNHKNEIDYFLSMRAVDLSTFSEVGRASRFIYLNKTCFNGLYRENSKGKFNVPFGKYTNPNICDEENLKEINKYLNEAKIDIRNTDFRTVCDDAGEKDLVYFDPPYHPLKVVSFTKYHKTDFGEKDQKELADLFSILSKIGCYVMMSNSNTEFVRELYKDYKIEDVSIGRSINSKGDGRKKDNIEVLIRNW